MRDPGSIWSPLPEAGTPDGKTKTQFIVHSTGDNGKASATRKYFSGPTLNESTFIVGWGPDDPTLQIMDSTDVADANGSANGRGISVEVVGDGVGGYNAWQRSELIRLGRWARANHPIAARIIPSEPESGFGWHVMFGAPGPWAKGAKVCPGKARINELKSDIFPAIFTGKGKPDSGGFLMALTDDEQYELLANSRRIRGNDPNIDSFQAVGMILTRIESLVKDTQQRVRGNDPNVDSLQSVAMELRELRNALNNPAA